MAIGKGGVGIPACPRRQECPRHLAPRRPRTPSFALPCASLRRMAANDKAGTHWSPPSPAAVLQLAPRGDRGSQERSCRM
jgi:hypothetical protein